MGKTVLFWVPCCSLGVGYTQDGHTVSWCCLFWSSVLEKSIEFNFHTFMTGVALIAKFCVNIAISGAVRILATSPRHHTQNDWTSIQQVTAHWWLPRHSTLDRFANSVWSQPWLRTPPRHKSSQWRAESDLREEINAQAAVIFVCMAT